MKILTGSLIGQMERYRAENTPNSVIDTLEAAAEITAREIAMKVEQHSKLLFMVGCGRNGASGLAVARMLANAGFDCTVVLIYDDDMLCEECREYIERLPESVEVLHGKDKIPISNEVIIIDAILGGGLTGPVQEPARTIIRAVNVTGCRVISIDIPSGMKPEFGNNPEDIIKASETIVLDFPRLAMLMSEAGECCGEITIVDTEMNTKFLEEVDTDYIYVNKELVARFLQQRKKFSSKGDYGHALLVCGSHLMTGAAVLSTAAALRSGCGRVTTHLPQSEAYAIHINCPAAMVSHDPEDFYSTLPGNLERYTVCGVGCGLGKGKYTVAALAQLMEEFHGPMVFDADALNIIASNPGLRSKVPANSILTPHLGEFERLVGKWSDEEEKYALLRGLAAEMHSTVVLKGFHTKICMEDGKIYVNESGTAGMATGGSGDVLTGLITGLVARGYSARQAAILGVYVHGIAGEKAAEYFGIEGMNSSDIIDFIGESLAELG